MSSESGDIAEVDDKSESKPKDEPEPMQVGCGDVATARNESQREEADDKPPSAATDSVNVSEDQVKAEVGEEAKDEGEVAGAESKEQFKKSVETEDTEDTQIDSNSQSGSISDYDTFFPKDSLDIDFDSESEEELNALTVTGEMGLRGSKTSKKANGKKASSTYQNSSSDEYEDTWSRPWRSREERSSSDEYEDTWSRPWRSREERTKKKKPFSFTRRWSERDTEEYRKGYPGKRDNLSQRLNLDFYLNKTPSRPDGDYIDNIHKKWFGDHHRLEIHHGYIQWLFPIRESGMNFHAKELQLHEAEGICKNRTAHKRVLKSYKMMLDFYGIRLKNEETGELERAENWKERFSHLNRSMHNYLRITRILKSLGELDYEYLKVPFVRFVLEEALRKKTLEKTVNSCYNYWMETIKDDKDREKLKDYANELLSSDDD